MQNRMLRELFALPLFLAVMAFAALWLLSWFIPDIFEDSPFLAPLGQQARGLALPVCWVLTGAATITSFYQTVRLWLWRAGKTGFCHGMVSVRDGRYGPYVHCLACGTNRSLR